jgi:hypothetical protein
MRGINHISLIIIINAFGLEIVKYLLLYWFFALAGTEGKASI